MSKLYYLDFDRTLFNNHEFFQDFSTILAAYFEINGDELHRMATKHNQVRTSAKGIFSAFDMIREEYPQIQIADVKRIATQELADRTYLFADVERTLKIIDAAKDDIHIVTVGTDEYQRFKFEFAPKLKYYPLTITQESKGKCLLQFKEQFLQYDDVVLVDDRGDTFDEDFRELGIKGVRLNRVDSTYSDKPTPPDIKEIATLIELVS